MCPVVVLHLILHCHLAVNLTTARRREKNIQVWLDYKTPNAPPLDNYDLQFFHTIYHDNKGLNMPNYIFEHVISNSCNETTGVVIDSGAAIFTHLHTTAFDSLLPKINAHMKRKGKRMSKRSGFYCWDNPGGFHDPSLPTI